MAITGTVKIELFDAATGEKTDEVVSSNMVTNAVRNVVNPDRAIVDGGYMGSLNDSWSENWVGATSPIGRKLFKGIMLFNKKLTENVDNIIPDQSTRDAMIGCAGGGSALAGNDFRGTYNATESRQLSNGYSHVWDFATNQANGVINAVALTSEWGGEMGWKATEDDMKKSLMPMSGENTWMNSVSTADVPSGSISKFRMFDEFSVPSGSDTGYSSPQCGVFVAGGRLFQVVISDDRKTMDVYAKNLLNDLSLVETLWTAPVSFAKATPSLRDGAVRYTFTSVNEFCNTLQRYVDVCLIPNGIMFVSYRIASAEGSDDTLVMNTTSVVYENGDVNVTEWGVTSSLATQISTTRGYNGCASDGEYLYVYPNKAGYLDKIYKIKIRGNREESEIELPFTAPTSVASADVHLGNIANNLYVYGGRNVPLLYLLNSTKTAFVASLSKPVGYYGSYTSIIQLAQLTPPWVLCIDNLDLRYSQEAPYPVIVSPYLATINNLQTAVTKTASKTMKITYTIQNT